MKCGLPHVAHCGGESTVPHSVCTQWKSKLHRNVVLSWYPLYSVGGLRICLSCWCRHRGTGVVNATCGRVCSKGGFAMIGQVGACDGAIWPLGFVIMLLLHGMSAAQSSRVYVVDELSK